MDTECCQPIYDTLDTCQCSAWQFHSLAHRLIPSKLNTSVRPVWKYSSQLTVQALDSWVDRRKVVLHLDKCCEFRPVCGGGGVKVRLWEKKSAYG